MKKIIAIAVLAVFTVMIFTAVMNIVSNKESVINYYPFISSKDNFDVLFLGTSHMHHAVAPMELFHDYGIASYNLGVSGNRIASMYWQIRNALKYTKPRLIVIDCAYFSREEKINSRVGYVHRLFDVFPFTLTKVKAIIDLCSDESKRYELLFPFASYHNRWSELTKNDFNTSYTKTLSNVIALSVSPAELQALDMSPFDNIEGVGVEYLEKISQLCDEQGIELLLTFVPFKCTSESINDNAFLNWYCHQKGIPFLDFNTLLKTIKPCIDFHNHSSDNNSHVNRSGTLKLTHFIGEYIHQHYSLPDRREDPVYFGWGKEYENYIEHLYRTFAETNGKDSPDKLLKSMLMIACDPNVDVVIETHGTAILSDPVYKALFENIGFSASEVTEQTRYCVKRGRDGQCDYLDTESDSSIGKITKAVSNEKKKQYGIFLDDMLIYQGKERSSEKTGVYVTLLKSGKPDAIDSVYFGYTSGANDPSDHFVIQKPKRIGKAKSEDK